jgi:hypothetical protein
LKVYIRDNVGYYHRKSCKAMLGETSYRTIHAAPSCVGEGIVIRDGDKDYPPCPVCFPKKKTNTI